MTTILSTAAVGHLAAERCKIEESLDPHTWRRVNAGGDGDMWATLDNALKVIWSISIEQDGRLWMHVSVSRPDRLPSYNDMKRVKHLFIGDERNAYSVWAADPAHVNLHSRCLHLWCVLDGADPLPDFSRGGGSI